MVPEFVRRHFFRHCCRSPLQFSLWTGLEATAIAMPLVVLLTIASMPDRHDLDHWDAANWVVKGVLIAPVIETLIFQLFPIVCLRWLRTPFSWQVGISTFFFWLAHHVSASPSTGICAGLIGGFYLGFGYAYWAEQSHGTAYWTTVVHHMVGNGCVFLLLLIFGAFVEEGQWVPDWVIYTALIGGSALYWICLARNNAAFFAGISDRTAAVAGQSHVDFTFRFDDCVVSAFVKGADLERRVWMKEPNDDSWTGWHH